MKGGATSVDCKTKESFIFTERRSDQNKTGGEEKGLKAITAIFTRIVWQEGKKLRRVPRCSNQLSRLAKKQDVVSCVCVKVMEVTLTKMGVGVCFTRNSFIIIIIIISSSSSSSSSSNGSFLFPEDHRKAVK